jgi:hypothetical protein
MHTFCLRLYTSGKELVVRPTLQITPSVMFQFMFIF